MIPKYHGEVERTQSQIEIAQSHITQEREPPCVPAPGCASALAGVRCGSAEGNFSTCQRRGCTSFGTGDRLGFLNSSCIFLSHKGSHCGEGTNHNCCCYTCALRETPIVDATVEAHADFLRYLEEKASANGKTFPPSLIGEWDKHGGSGSSASWMST